MASFGGKKIFDDQALPNVPFGAPSRSLLMCGFIFQAGLGREEKFFLSTRRNWRALTIECCQKTFPPTSSWNSISQVCRNVCLAVPCPRKKGVVLRISLLRANTTALAWRYEQPPFRGLAHGRDEEQLRLWDCLLVVRFNFRARARCSCSQPSPPIRPPGSLEQCHYVQEIPFVICSRWGILRENFHVKKTKFFCNCLTALLKSAKLYLVF